MSGFLSNLQVYLETGSILSYLVVFVGGVLTSFTPCVYPIIPITVSYVGARSRGSKVKGFFLSFAYVLGLAVTYAALGGFAALTGKIFGQVQMNPWIYLAAANIFILLGLSMLEVFTLPIPGFMSGTFQPSVGKKGFLGSFIVGLVSGFIVGPCTAPILMVLLTYVATRQNVVFGMSLLFVFAFGMGILLILLGTFAGLLANLPEAGNWMVKVKKFFGWGLIIMGEYFLIVAGKLFV